MKTQDPKDPIEPKIKLRRVKRTVRHDFDAPELAKLNETFHEAVQVGWAAKAEFDGIKATYAGKIKTAEANAQTISSTISAGYELREKPLVFVLDAKRKMRTYYLEDAVAIEGDAETIKEGFKPLVEEPATEADFQNELLEAEQKFELKEEIALFPTTGPDRGVLVIGRFGNKWFPALRVTLNQRKIEERLDSEQPCYKKRPDAVKKALDRFKAWLVENFGKDTADGFGEALDTVWEAHKERVE